MKIVIASYTPYLKDVDDAILMKYLTNEGINVDHVSWDDKSYDWKSIDGVVIRSTWDYHERINEYIAWLKYLKENNVKVLNDPDIVINNILKDRQIKWLKEHKVSMMDCEVFSLYDENMLRPEDTFLNTIKKYFANYCGKSMFVLKPTISACSKDTYLVDPFNLNQNPNNHVTENEEKLFFDLLKRFNDRGLILQVFNEGIANGEYGLVFLNKNFIQAVVKKPGRLYGEEIQTALNDQDVPEELLVMANSIVNLLPQDKVLVIRVDAVKNNGEFRLMELELAEPNIYIRATDGIGLHVYDPDKYLPEVERIGCHNEKLIKVAKNIVERFNNNK